MTKSTVDIRLILLADERIHGSRTATARISVCYLTKDGLRNFLFGSYDDEDRALGHLTDLEIYAQAEPKPDGDGTWYGWSAEYRKPFTVDLTRAEAMVKTLKAINRRLTKLDEKFGRAQDFAEYAGRVADAIGAGAGGQIFGCRAEKGRDYNGTGWQFGGVDSLRHWLDDAIKSEQ